MMVFSKVESLDAAMAQCRGKARQEEADVLQRLRANLVELTARTVRLRHRGPSTSEFPA
jgi:hypothetical protein